MRKSRWTLYAPKIEVMVKTSLKIVGTRTTQHTPAVAPNPRLNYDHTTPWEISLVTSCNLLICKFIHKSDSSNFCTYWTQFSLHSNYINLRASLIKKCILHFTLTIRWWAGSVTHLINICYIKITSSKEGFDLPFPERLVTIRDHTRSNNWCNTASRTQAFGVIGGNPNLLRRGTWKRLDGSSSCLETKRKCVGNYFCKNHTKFTCDYVKNHSKIWITPKHACLQKREEVL